MPTIKNVNMQDGDIISVVKDVKFTANTTTNYPISTSNSGVYTAVETFKEEFNYIPSADFMPFNDLPGGPSFPASLNLRELTLSGLRISKDTSDDVGTYFFYDSFNSNSYISEIEFEAISPGFANPTAPYKHVVQYSGYHCGLVDFKNKLEVNIQLNTNNTISIVGPVDANGSRTTNQVSFTWDSTLVTFKVWVNFSLNELIVISVNSGAETILLKDDIFNYITDVQQLFFGSKSFALDDSGHTIFIGNDTLNNSVSIELHSIMGYGDVIKHPNPIYKNTAFLKYNNYLDLVAWPKSKAFYSSLIDNETFPTESGTTTLDLDTTACFIYWSCGFTNTINPTGINTGVGFELVLNNTLLYVRVLYDVNTSTTYLAVYDDPISFGQPNNLSKYRKKILVSDTFTLSAFLAPGESFSSLLVPDQIKEDYYGSFYTPFTSDSRLTFGSFNDKGIVDTSVLFIFRDVEVYHLAKEDILSTPKFNASSNMTDIKEDLSMSITTDFLGYLTFSGQDFQAAKIASLTNYDINNTGIGIYLKLRHFNSLESHVELPFLIINRGIAGRGITLCAVRHSVHTIGNSLTPTTYNWFIYFKESGFTLNEVIYQNTQSALELSFLIENKYNLANCEFFIDIDPSNGLSLYYENERVISLAPTNLPLCLHDAWLNPYSFSVAFGKLWNYTFINSSYNQIIFSRVVISSSQGYEVLTALGPETETEKEVISKSGNIVLDIRDVS